jgi:acyl-coenzyme A synthetase/AMP-(fatty) acid ligase
VLPNDPGADPDALAAGIQQSLVGRLSVYKCPREVRVVSEIPRTATGKVQRFKLRESVKAAGQ